ncbi:hypothetical protein [Patulibacter sp.]|uniref:hypothetical protein n=1 Tax=Patulibacter sp. TaxID=1912859 RepID=UPI0027249036|nr:hypothetical protein [Patulibacter sp.]MDO9408834.1 hypothetical protein [Patulibacter sp.]
MDAPAADPSAVPADLDALAADDGAALRDRVRQAPVQRVPRADLDGHVGLSSRTLHELGVTIAPIGLRDVPAAVAGRLQIVAGVLVAGALLGFALAFLAEGVFGLLGVLENDRRDRVDSGAALATFVGLGGWGGVVLLRQGVRQVRAGRTHRRRARGAGIDPALDPQARPTVAVVREPHGLRVSLLWLRGDPSDAGLLEVRTIAEERVPADLPGAAEDLVDRYAEVVVRADAARVLPRHDGVAAAPASAPAALVAAAATELPTVDPRVAVPDGWDPEPLTDDGRAELAARLVRARPKVWNAAELERLAVDPARPLRHRPGRWPSDTARRAPLAPPLPTGPRRLLHGAAWTAGVVWVVAAGSMGSARRSEIEEREPVAFAALAVCVVLVAIVVVVRRRAAGRRLLRSVHRAARSQPASLERGVPDGAGRVLVLHGVRDDGTDRLELVHVRPAPQEGADRRLQVRTLAWWEPRPGGVLEAREVGQDFWRIADDAGFVAGRRAADARGVERLNVLLGRSTDRAVRRRLHDEPLAWAVWPFALFFAVFALGIAVSDDPFDEGGGIALAVLTWPALTAWLFLRAARRVQDPVD